NNKIAILEEILEIEQIDLHNVCYIGDDINDIPVFQKIGFAATVANAPEYVKSETDYVAAKTGGNGAVREAIEYILIQNDLMNVALSCLLKDTRI
ncbi:MAG: HAD hydrolase family protein, partial [Candidatus Thermoplasmatota archaeon]|nr:HAD hydrolase family protein [Candidatus Thermoplasmatota archaeon]